MKKSVGILSGLAVAIAVATTAGAWYTGKQLPAELDNALARSNAELQKALVTTGGSLRIERVSLEQHFFSSTAQYRLKARDINVGEGEVINFDVGVTDHIEHGPFPWSRVKALKLVPVMAVSNSTLQKDDAVAPWFDAAGGKVPLSAQTSLGYGGMWSAGFNWRRSSSTRQTATASIFRGCNWRSVATRTARPPSSTAMPTVC